VLILASEAREALSGLVHKLLIGLARPFPLASSLAILEDELLRAFIDSGIVEVGRILATSLRFDPVAVCFVVHAFLQSEFGADALLRHAGVPP
jgi:hypothetical protein